MSGSNSNTWTKTIIFIIVAVLLVAAIVFIVIRFCMGDKKKKTGGKKKSGSSSKSKSKSAKKKTRRAPSPKKPFAQVPLQVKPVDETATRSGSLVATSSSQDVKRTEEEEKQAKSPSNPKNLSSEDSNQPKEHVTVLCTYGKGWKAKAEPPKDFSFSIESD